MPIRVFLADRRILLSFVGSIAGPASALWSILVKDKTWRGRLPYISEAWKLRGGSCHQNGKFLEPSESVWGKETSYFQEGAFRPLEEILWGRATSRRVLPFKGKVSFRLIFSTVMTPLAPKLACPGHVQDCIPHLLMVILMWNHIVAQEGIAVFLPQLCCC